MLALKRNKEGELVQKFSSKTVINHLVPLKEMFKHAVRWGYLRESPALYVERPRVEHEEMDFLTPDEIRLMLESVTPKHHALFLDLTPLNRSR